MNILPLTEDLILQAQQIIEHLCGNPDNFIKAEFYGASALFVQRSKPMGQGRYIVNTDHGLMVIMDQEGMNFYPKPIVGKFYYCKLDAGGKILPKGDKKYLIQFHSFDPLIASYQMINEDGSLYNFDTVGSTFNNITLGDHVKIESFEDANRDSFL